MTAAGQIDSGAYADWKAPPRDGQILIWPEPARLYDDLRQNHQRLGRAEEARLLGLPLNEVRRMARAWIGAAEADRPLIATGHQTELYHPGVWVKNALIDALATKTGGAAYHFAVDTDSPKHLLLRWPGASMPITDDKRIASAAWSSLLDAPTPVHVSALLQALRNGAQDWNFAPAAFDVLESLQRLSLEPAPLSNSLGNALHELDWSLGLRHHAMITSPICTSPPYLMFVSHVLAHARRFGGQYNAALRAYRQAHGVRTAMRPMPDLFLGDDSIEIPFWLDDLAGQKRSRPSVFDVGGRSVLKLVAGEEFAIDPSEDAESASGRLARFLSGTSHRLAPRALTLTMFLRLFVADQFIHGIGGGRYDQVLDTLIHTHFGLAPPRFAVATATMLLPTALGRERACVPCVIAEGRRLRHGALGGRKTEYLRRIEELPRRSRARRAVFTQMQSDLQQTWQSSQQIGNWERRLEDTRLAENRDAVEFDRELFYAMQPRQRLAQLIDGVRVRVGATAPRP